MLAQIQLQLEAIYEVRSAHRAHDFLVDEETCAQLGGTGRSREELLVLEEEGALDLALYLSPALLEAMRSYEEAPVMAIERELGGFCEVVEGVSHFMYLAHTAALERRVSLLELEAQAEVDKFALCTVLRWGANVGAWAEELVSRLFDAVAYLPTLSEEERWRYEQANRLARRYALRLLPHVRARRIDRLLAELRHSYRLGAEAKIAYFSKEAA